MRLDLHQLHSDGCRADCPGRGSLARAVSGRGRQSRRRITIYSIAAEARPTSTQSRRPSHKPDGIAEDAHAYFHLKHSRAADLDGGW